MAQYGWSNCPDDVRQQVEQYIVIQGDVLGADLVGVYLHGSLAMGCFNPRCSDVDLLVVVEGRLAAPVMADLARRLVPLNDEPRPLESSHLCREDLSPWRHPTPYQFHFGDNLIESYRSDLASGAWRDWASRRRLDGDLAGHVTMVRERGVALLGPPTAEVFPVVPPVDYEASILEDADWLMDHLDANPLYAVLNLCRVWAWLTEGLKLSKDEGAEWARRKLDAPHLTVVEAGLEAYRGTGRLELPSGAIRELVDLIRGRIGAYRS